MVYLAGVLLLGSSLLAMASPITRPLDDDEIIFNKVISAPQLRVIMKRTTTNSHQRRSLIVGLHSVISPFNATLSHLFKGTSGEIHHQLGKYYHVEAHVDHHETLIQHLRRHPDVDHAYISPALIIPEVNLSDTYKSKLNTRAEATTKTPDMTKTQAPMWEEQGNGHDGMDIDYSWSQRGGRGDGVEVFQIEFNWLHTHEDLQKNMRFVGSDGPIGSHATGAAGVVGADENGIGYTGIVPNAYFTARTLYFDDASAKSNSQNLARSLQWCVDNGKAGDVIMLIIVIAMGSDGVTGPVEWYPEYFDVVKAATDKGMVLVTSAGNDGASLDNPAYGDTLRRAKFGNTAAAKYKNPFNTANPSSGMIIVGSHNPPGDIRKPHARSSWSNYGNRVNVATWGRYIKTPTARPECNTWDGSPNACYMDFYTGTSASGAVMAGVVASIQGAVRGAGRKPLNAWDFRDLFNDSRCGVQQADWPAGASPKSRRVGMQPDLRKMVPLAIAMSKQRHG